jgi:hypothetical protein
MDIAPGFWRPELLQGNVDFVEMARENGGCFILIFEHSACFPGVQRTLLQIQDLSQSTRID